MGADSSVPKDTPSVVVIEPDRAHLQTIRGALADSGCDVLACETYGQAQALLAANVCDTVIAGMEIPDMPGVSLVERILAEDANLPLIVLTSRGDVGTAVEAVKRGAYYFLEKPVDKKLLVTTVLRAVEKRGLVLDNLLLERRLQAGTSTKSRFYGLIGNHPVMRDLYTIIEAFGEERDPVLITGETGTGKELVARALHEINQPSGAPYVAVNMGALPSEMIESELFGYEKGAFTGALQRKIGRFEFAGTGTIFLDEICSMPPHLQARLLRVLEVKKFSRLGSNELIPMRARVIAATNRDLEKEVEQGRFRQDLYFRLNVLPIYLPPLRKRKEDIPLLIEYFLREYCDSHPEKPAEFTPQHIEELCRGDWPGNIRELRNVVRRQCVMGHNPAFALDTEDKHVANLDHFALDSGERLTWKVFMETQERRYLEHVLNVSGGKVISACKFMDISRKNLYDKINKYGIDLAPFRCRSASVNKTAK